MWSLHISASMWGWLKCGSWTNHSPWCYTVGPIATVIFNRNVCPANYSSQHAKLHLDPSGPTQIMVQCCQHTCFYPCYLVSCLKPQLLASCDYMGISAFITKKSKFRALGVTEESLEMWPAYALNVQKSEGKEKEPLWIPELFEMFASISKGLSMWDFTALQTRV